jgi:hypothetical protein
MNIRDGIAPTISALVTSNDVAEALAHLVTGCVEAYPASAVAVLARDGAQDLELLSSSSHQAGAIELLQIQSGTGPCVDAIDTGERVFGSGADELVRRWGKVGQAILDGGYTTVHAYPMTWRGTPIGGLNIFVDGPSEADTEVGQVFADLATLAVLHSNDLIADHLFARVHEAVLSRTVIEQAKGVLAYELDVPVSEAYAHLRWLAAQSHQTITTAANSVINRAVGSRAR